jgi:hypothetical protein
VDLVLVQGWTYDEVASEKLRRRHDQVSDKPRSRARYKIVEHDGGWAYKLGDVFFETFASHDDARAAAEQVAEGKQVGGEPVDFAYQDASGEWR